MNRGGQHGFTLVELIMVIVIAGILAAVALPRFFDRDLFDRRGYFEELLAAARYAQKVAVATGCDVQFAVTANSYALTQHQTSCTSGPFTRPVVNPAGDHDGDGDTDYARTAPAGITSSAATVTFRSDGTASGDATISVGGYSFKIYSSTAYSERQ